MNRQYWDDIAEYYESEIFDVLDNDSEGLIVGLIEKYGKDCSTASDLGCGIGRFLPTLSDACEKVLAVDFSRNILARAQEECSHLDNVEFIPMDLSCPGASLPDVDLCISVNALITASLEERIKMFDFIAEHLEENGYFILVVPSLESAMLYDFRQIEWNLRSGLKPSAAVNADFRSRKIINNSEGLHEGIVLVDDVPTKHYLKEELVATLECRGIKIIDLFKIEYPWSTEFISPPRWMKGPYPWDWLTVAQKLAV